MEFEKDGGNGEEKVKKNEGERRNKKRRWRKRVEEVILRSALSSVCNVG
jgi:hypothetical protein